MNPTPQVILRSLHMTVLANSNVTVLPGSRGKQESVINFKNALRPLDGARFFEASRQEPFLKSPRCHRRLREKSLNLGTNSNEPSVCDPITRPS